MNNWQTKAAEFSQNHNLHHPPSVYALDLMSKLGDTLYSLCQLATAAGVDLDNAFTATLQKYEQRWQEKRNFGSMNAER